MRKQYYNLILPKNPIELIEKLNLEFFTLLDNGKNSYMLGYCNNQSRIVTINSKAGYAELNSQEDFLFGYIPFDQKKHFLPIEQSDNKGFHNFDNAAFLFADGVFIFKNDTFLFYGSEFDFKTVSTKLKTFTNPETEKDNSSHNPITLQHKTSKKQYIEDVTNIKKHIQNGDIYEMNYCINIAATNAKINPHDSFFKLKELTNAPFSAFLQINNTCVLSASPERFINKTSTTITSQPIKGTAKRGRNLNEDKDILQDLKSNQKEIAENVMIVDLVRNDLSKIADKSTVKVTELCKAYTFETVHQLISTVQCEVPTHISFVKIIEALFPMGSMTGAPKISALKIIEKYENFKREVYSGSIGYFSPNNSFDFNVVIRSVICNTLAKTVSISAGSAITIKSSAEEEYNECLLKLKAIQSIFGSNSTTTKVDSFDQ